MATYSEPTPTRRGRPARFSRDAIVEEAIDAIREGGVESLAMRSLAERLGTTPATLYRHIDGQDELIAEAVDRIVSQVEVPAIPADDNEIEEWLIEAAGAYRSVMLRYPGTADHLLLRGPTGEHGLRKMGQMCSVLARIGMTTSEVAWAYDWLMTTVSTYTAKEDRLHRVGGGGNVAARLQERVASIDDGELSEVLAQFTGDMEASFDRTTRLVVEMLVAGRAPSD
ncbi:MAG: TetR/AcrR family transcriptional regulator [Actinomycetota bacterium]